MIVTAVSGEGKEVTWNQYKGKLVIYFKNPAATGDTLQFTIDYHGIPADGLIISRNKYGDQTFLQTA